LIGVGLFYVKNVKVKKIHLHLLIQTPIFWAMPHDSNFGCLFFSSSPQVSKKVPIGQKLWEEIDYLEIAQFQARAIPPRPIDLRSQPKNYLYGVEISAKSIYSEKS